METTVKLIGGLIHTLGFSERTMQLPPGATVADLLATLGINAARPTITSKDGWMIRLDEEIHDGDRIVVAPVFSGG
jgi:sulfur carrier protein ThiS